MNSIFTPRHSSTKSESSHFLSHNKWKHILSMMIYVMPITLTGQVATEIIRTSDSTALVTVLESGNVGIGVTDPMSRLQIAGTAEMTGLKLTNGAMNNYVLTTDANGVGSWQPTQLVGIGGSGNSGYIPMFTGNTTLGNSGLFQSGGNFGIGTDVPDRPITIYGAGAAMKIHNPLSNSNPSIFLANDFRSWQIFIDGSNNMTDGFAIRDANAGAERFIIDTDGDVAIGDFDPTAKLHVGGTVKATAFTSSSPLLLQTDHTTRIYADDITGFVGINTTSPMKLLHVHGQGILANSASISMPRTEPFVSIDADLYSTTMGILSVYDRRQQTTLSPTPTVYIENANADTDAGNLLLQIVSAGTNRFLIRHDGKVGIGTSSPSSLLHVAGTTEMTGFKLTSDVTPNYVLTTDASGNGTWQPAQLVGIGGSGTISYLSKFTGATTLGSSGIVEDGSGKVGIGTGSPLQQLSIGNGYTNSFHFETATDFPTIHFGDGYGIYINYGFGGDLGFAFNGSAGTGVWGRFLVDGTELMRLSAAGDLGIGSINPQSKLHVEGTAQMTGFKMNTGAVNNYVLTSDGSGVGSWQATQLVGIGGSGNSGYLPLFTGNTTVGNSGLFQSGGNFGIGTEVPDRPITIYGAGAAMKIDNPLSNSNPSIFMSNDVRSWQVFIDGGNNMTDGFAIRDANAGQERFIIDTDGDVAIGDFNPTSKLHVDGTVKASAFSSTSPLLLQTNGTTRIYVDDVTGNAGIGTDTPTEKLDVAGTVRASALNITGTTVFSNPVGIATSPEGSSHLHVAGNVTINTANQLKLDGGAGTAMIRYNHIGSLTEFFCYPSGGFQFYQGGSSLVRIKSDGNVGIGTTSPSEKLDVAGTVKASALNITGTTVFSSPVGIATSPEGSSHLHVAGNVTINTANQLKLDGGAGTAMIRYNHIGSLTEFFCYPSGGFQFYQGGSSLMRIKSDGNVGIGTTSPSEKLDVAGTVRASAFSSSSPLLLQTNGITRIFINDTTGHVGIGTDSTVNLLTIKFNSSTDPIADAWTTYSSRRWKANIMTLEDALVHVMKLRGVSYQWKADGKKDIGFIAEEVGEIYPEIVAYEENGIDARSVDYSRLVPVLVEAMKEQQEIIEQQRSELDSYSARLEKLEQLLNER